MSKKIFKGVGKVVKKVAGAAAGFALGGPLGAAAGVGAVSSASKALKKKKTAAATTTPAADGKGPVVTPLAANDPRLAAARGASGGGLGSPTILSSDYMGSLLQRSNRLGS